MNNKIQLAGIAVGIICITVLPAANTDYNRFASTQHGGRVVCGNNEQNPALRAVDVDPPDRNATITITFSGDSVASVHTPYAEAVVLKCKLS